MDAAFWDQLNTLVADALDHPEAARDAFLRSNATSDVILQEARELLDAHAAAEADGALESLFSKGAALPDTIGPWRITGLLGKGGMGVVYRAERADGLYEREVALKRLHPGRGHEARLADERRILARLEHPGIARLYEGGIDTHGAPYVVMERVDGGPITDYADQHDLGLGARVRLLIDVCDAVAYAHRHLIVHRDVKPSNVFASGPPDAPAVKLLDFGIARLLETPSETETTLAHTPAYAAPEQILGQPVTTATDVYSLGVLAYELLAGQRPYSLSNTTAREAERIVCDVDPPAPSSVAPSRWARDLRGDLDIVLAKALAKEPGHRYASAEALGDDLRRVLASEPVAAQPASAFYRARLFVRRHRLSVAATAAVAIALIGGLGGTTWQAQAAAQERDRARAEAEKAAAVTAFLSSTLAAASPEVGTPVPSSELRIIDALAHAAENVEGAFPGQPDIRAAVYHTLGKTLLDLGLHTDAEAPLRTALRLRDSLHASSLHISQIETLDALGLLALWLPELDGADAFYDRSLSLRRQLYGPDSPEAAVGLANLAERYVELDDADAAIPLLEEALALAEAESMDGTIEHAEVQFVLASAQLRAGYSEDAEASFSALLDTADELVETLDLDPEDARIATLLIGLGQSRLLLQNAAAAEAPLRDALTRRASRFDAGHPLLAEAQGMLGIALAEQGNMREAEPLLRAALSTFETGDPFLFYQFVTRIELASIEANRGRTVEIEALREDLRGLQNDLSPDHPWARLALQRAQQVDDRLGF
ncbi:MAG: serine/threonine-protein kinase [Bacteroidota bacterium]